jgi:hypothetical protein
VQILYVNLATDGLPALALSVDPGEQDLMRRTPRSRGEGIFTRPVVALIAVGGAWSAVATLGLFLWALSTDRPLAEAMTMTFATLVLIEFFKAYSFRSDRNSIVERPFANKWLNLAVAWELALLALVVNVPFLQDAFGTQSLEPGTWLLVAALALTIVPVLEVAKLVLRRRQGQPLGPDLGRRPAADDEVEDRPDHREDDHEQDPGRQLPAGEASTPADDVHERDDPRDDRNGADQPEPAHVRPTRPSRRL